MIHLNAAIHPNARNRHDRKDRDRSRSIQNRDPHFFERTATARSALKSRMPLNVASSFSRERANGATPLTKARKSNVFVKPRSERQHIALCEAR